VNENRDDLGFVNLDFLVAESLSYNNYVDKKRRVFNFNYGNIEYYFKITACSSDIYNELIASELAKDYGIPCAEYDLASINSLVGVCSKSVFGVEDKFYSIEKILEKEYGFIPLKYNNLEDIWYALSLRYDKNIVEQLMNQIVDLFLFDIMIANSDRNIGNYGIIENKENVSLAPLFDNEKILSDSCIEYGGYCIAVRREDFFWCYRDLSDDDNFLYTFLRISDSEYIKQVEDKLWVISEENILDVFSRIENKISSTIPIQIKKKMLEKFANNKYMINEVLNKVKVKKR